ncbi:MAG TPA: serine hydrolase domain-containing protein [Polyangiales bacterium]|nr:serine hydrolase domain-containing protein [Polyangiales bacterium]
MSGTSDKATAEIHGVCDARFDALREAFASNFESYGEQGAAIAVILDGHLVVDLWGGMASRGESRAWTRNTLVNVYSTSKGLAALCAHRLIDAGLVELDAPLARYWPEFAANGKQGITVRHVLSHRAGVPALREPLPHAALYDQATIARALAAQAPYWEPGTQHGYHAQTFGFLLGELVLRVTGRSLGTYLREEIAGPLNADVHLGLAAEHDARVAKVTRPLAGASEPAPGEVDLVRVFQREPTSLTAQAFMNPAPAPGAVNTREFRAAEIPASNVHATAEGLARIYAPLSLGGSWNGFSLLSGDAVASCQAEQSFGHDAVLRLTTRFGLGFMLSQTSHIPAQQPAALRGGPGYFSPSPMAFGHPGMGGSIAFADTDARLAFGYVMNRAGTNILVGERPRRLIDALYSAL